MKMKSNINETLKDTSTEQWF